MTMAKSHWTTSLLGNFISSFLDGEEVGQYCSGHVCGPGVGNGVGEGVGGGVTFTGGGVGGHVNVVSHTEFVVKAPLQLPLFFGLPEIGSH